MTRFLRDNIVGQLALGIIGSLLATWLAALLPNPATSGAAWRSVFFQPIPAVVVFLYSFALVWACNVLARRWEAHERQRVSVESDALNARLRIVEAERDSLQRELLQGRGAATLVEHLMRFVAV